MGAVHLVHCLEVSGVGEEYVGTHHVRQIQSFRTQRGADVLEGLPHLRLDALGQLLGARPAANHPRYVNELAGRLDRPGIHHSWGGGPVAHTTAEE